jgi:ATP-dependent DNA helicase DinG
MTAPDSPERAFPSHRSIALPESPVLVVGFSRAIWLSPDGEIEDVRPAEAADRARRAPPIVCYRPGVARRLAVQRFDALDVLELFALVHPAAFCLPTPAGVASVLGIDRPTSLDAAATALRAASIRMLEALAGDRTEETRRIAMALSAAGWNWSPAVDAVLGIDASGLGPRDIVAGLDVWRRLPEWQERAPPPPPRHLPPTADESLARLADLLPAGSEDRPQQRSYAAAVTDAFRPRDVEGAPHVVLAEAGTGVGKTLGYIAPASAWAERNAGVVWLSTFTRNLQRQVDQELDRLFPDPREKAEKVIVRKGRENYLCLLNFEEDAGRAPMGGGGVALALMARWTTRSRDGDMVGGDFPAWLVHLFGPEHTIGLTDRRGECVYSACPHYRRCFIEINQRKARYAELVIANHALVLVQAALSPERELPTRYVFDEGHHVFDAADSAFASHLSGWETADLRRWLRGAEGRRRRSRGLERRIGDLVAGDNEGEAALAASIQTAGILPDAGWSARIERNEPRGATEAFLARVFAHVRARQTGADSGYDLEADTGSPAADLVDAAAALDTGLERLITPMRLLGSALEQRLDDEADTLETAVRVRIEAAVRMLRRRIDTVRGWRSMLADLPAGPPDAFVDWFGIARSDGRMADVGMFRHWIDPTIPFAEAVLSRTHGAVITSASLRDRSRSADDDWVGAEIRTGVNHLPLPARRISVPSPFDYGSRTRVFVVTDVARGSSEEVAAAYRELFRAAGGGALGLFTAISRLRQVHRRIAGPLEDAGIPLYAQHVDAIDTATLVDIFRAETDSCLLGTDAVRDGVDVPGRALRLIVFDRVPWPRPDILHRARRAAFGGARYDDMITRFRLKQAYGRLIRRADDRGVFVLLDRMLPTRLADAFPADVAVTRVGLADAVAATRAFLEEVSA